MAKRILLFVALISLSSALHGQVAETITVEVVDVPVYVIGRDQKPVLGLTKDAFEIFEDGKRVPSSISPSSISGHRRGVPRLPMVKNDACTSCSSITNSN